MTQDAIEANILRHWKASAGTGRRRRGREWYPTMREWCEEVATQTGRTVEQVVAVLAITSPGAQLVTNMTWTFRVCSGALETAGRFPNANAPKIAGVLASPEAAHEFVLGPKVGPFHKAILGDRKMLVLDRWAYFAALGVRSDDDLGKITKATRDAVDAAYRRLARRLRWNVRDLQAAVWLQVRETTPTAAGRINRLKDVTA